MAEGGEMLCTTDRALFEATSPLQDGLKTDTSMPLSRCCGVYRGVTNDGLLSYWGEVKNIKTPQTPFAIAWRVNTISNRGQTAKTQTASETSYC